MAAAAAFSSTSRKRAATDQLPAPFQHEFFVRNLPREADEEALSRHFSTRWKVSGAAIFRDVAEGYSKRFGLVCFSDRRISDEDVCNHTDFAGNEPLKLLITRSLLSYFACPNLKRLFHGTKMLVVNSEAAEDIDPNHLLSHFRRYGSVSQRGPLVEMATTDNPCEDEFEDCVFWYMVFSTSEALLKASKTSHCLGNTNVYVSAWPAITLMETKGCYDNMIYAIQSILAYEIILGRSTLQPHLKISGCLFPTCTTEKKLGMVDAGVHKECHVETNGFHLNMTPLSLGIEIAGGLMAPLIPRNTIIPTKKSLVFTTCVDVKEFTIVVIQIFEGERPFAKDCRLLGELNLTGISPSPRGTPLIEVTFEIDGNGILIATADEKGYEYLNWSVILTNSKFSLYREEIQRLVRNAEKFTETDKEKKEKFESRNQLVAYVHTMNNDINDEARLADKIKQTGKEVLKMTLKDAMEWLDDHQDAEKEIYAKKLKNVQALCDMIVSLSPNKSG